MCIVLLLKGRAVCVGLLFYDFLCGPSIISMWHLLYYCNHTISSVQHGTKVDKEIPLDDEEVSDHQRLLNRLGLYGLVENRIQGDGNCQFCAISDQIYRSPEYHKFERQQIIQQLKSHPEIYGGYVPMTYAKYVNKMSKCGEWGDHVTLQAAADMVWKIKLP
ncbi:hypothetical protein SAY86_022417 [Trapa natans]|uniref:OTU domain-containing protein n=1 Tax=Trapa natans TaxID=22666 RepID=A0AAN7LTG4_TRANT|nr:hypothetical protein SAY86_022417 [Trapa natans]